MNGTLKKAGSSGRGLTGSEAVLLAGLMSVLWNKEKHTGVGIATQGLLTAFHIGAKQRENRAQNQHRKSNRIRWTKQLGTVFNFNYH